MKNSVKGVIFCMLAGGRATASVQQAYMLGTCVMKVCVLVLCFAKKTTSNPPPRLVMLRGDVH